MNGGNFPASEQMKLLDVHSLEVYQITSKGSDYKTFTLSDTYEQEPEYVRRLHIRNWEVFMDTAWHPIGDMDLNERLEIMRKLVMRKVT